MSKGMGCGSTGSTDGSTNDGAATKEDDEWRVALRVMLANSTSSLAVGTEPRNSSSAAALQRWVTKGGMNGSGRSVARVRGQALSRLWQQREGSAGGVGVGCGPPQQQQSSRKRARSAGDATDLEPPTAPLNSSSSVVPPLPLVSSACTSANTTTATTGSSSSATFTPLLLDDIEAEVPGVLLPQQLRGRPLLLLEVRHVDLSSPSSAGGELVARLLTRAFAPAVVLSTVVTLDLEHCAIGDGGVRVLADALTAPHSVSSNAVVGCAKGVAFAPLLPSVQFLYLASNGITARGAEILRDAAAGRTKEQVQQVEHQQDSDDATAAAACASAVAVAAGFGRRLRGLGLTNNPLAGGGRAVAALLHRDLCPAAEVVHLNHCGFTRDDAEALLGGGPSAPSSAQSSKGTVLECGPTPTCSSSKCGCGWSPSLRAVYLKQNPELLLLLAARRAADSGGGDAGDGLPSAAILR